MAPKKNDLWKFGLAAVAGALIGAVATAAFAEEPKPVHQPQAQHQASTSRKEPEETPSGKGTGKDMTCSICFTELEDNAAYIIEPCGHAAFCSSCVRRLNSCPVCRGRINKRIRLFFS